MIQSKLGNQDFDTKPHVASEEKMKTFTVSTLTILALTVAGFFAAREAALGFIGLVGLGALWIDSSRIRKDVDAKLEFSAFSLASLAVMALFVQGFFAVGEVAMGFTGLIGLISICMDVALLRAGRLEPIRTFSVPVIALIVMVLGGVFNISEVAIGFTGWIGLVGLIFDVSRKPNNQKTLEPQVLSDLELIRQDVPRA
jgi:hypothetical protein